MNIIEVIKNWWNTLFHKSEILTALGLDLDDLNDNSMLEYSQVWKRIYSGSEFKDVKDPKIASTICHEAARLVTSEMEVTVGDSVRAEYINNLLDTQILNRALKITEYSCAMGGIILKPRFDGQKLVTDMTTQDLFLPIQYDSTGIQGGIFIERRKKGKYTYTRLENWNYAGNGIYEITNKVYRSNYGGADIGQIDSLGAFKDWSEIMPEATITNAPVPMFAYFEMPGANYIDINNPMGVSLFGKAVDSIRAATTAYNALDWEVEGGELKRYRDISTFTAFKDDGTPIKDVNRQNEYMFNGSTGEGGTQLFETFSPALRVNDQITALNRHLNQIEAQCGFTQGTFSVDTVTGAVTATQIVSDNQKTYSTINSIQKAFETALNQLINIYNYYCDLYNLAPQGDVDPSFSWDDSVIASPDERRARIQLLVTQGYFPVWRYLYEYEGYTEQDAKEIASEVNNSPVPNLMDNFSGDSNA